MMSTYDETQLKMEERDAMFLGHSAGAGQLHRSHGSKNTFAAMHPKSKPNPRATLIASSLLSYCTDNEAGRPTLLLKNDVLLLSSPCKKSSELASSRARSAFCLRSPSFWNRSFSF